jgi:hypothetical protein
MLLDIKSLKEYPDVMVLWCKERINPRAFQGSEINKLIKH